jgi:hypothetical protein
MKLPSKPHKKNPLKHILQVFSTDFEDLSYDHLHEVAVLLKNSGITCQTYDEIVACLHVLEELELLELSTDTDEQSAMISYKVKKLYET